ncbi:hypothetical protein N8912_01900 [Rhodobacteraceae bacterium]|nr:hypothetical protein [Paracoccaceae bacterium]
MAALTLVSCLSLLFNKNVVSNRARLPTTADIAVSTSGILCLAIVIFKALSLPLVISATIFLN